MPTPRIFVSHSHFDNPICRQIVTDLRAAFPDTHVFYDETELHAGDEWLDRIQHEVVAAPIFIVILSPRSVVARWVKTETNLALNLAMEDPTRKIIPVRIDPAVEKAQILGFVPILILRQIIDLGDTAPGHQGQRWGDLTRVVSGQIPDEAPVAQVDPGLAQQLTSARTLARQVHEAVTRQEWPYAVMLGRRAVTLPGNQQDETLWYEYARALAAEGETAETLQAVAAAIALNDGRPELWTLKAQSLQQQGDGVGALAAWSEAFYHTGGRAGRLAILSEQFPLWLAGQQWNEAQRALRVAGQLAPNDVGWARRANELAGAQEAARQAEQQRQRQAQLAGLQQRYDAAQQAGQWAEAEQVCVEALQVAPGEPSWRQRQQVIVTERAKVEAMAKAEAARQQRERLARLLPARLQQLGFQVVAPNGVEVILPPTVEVAAGPFWMGSEKSRDPQARENEPWHQVTLGAYAIGVYHPVTVAEWACALNAGAKDVPTPHDWSIQLQHPDHPVENVLWLDVQAYLIWLRQATDDGTWRLPTEAEWEKAARWDARAQHARIYPWGDQWDKTKANTSDGGPGGTTPVGQYTISGDISPYGCRDMTGNVWEWCSSIYFAEAYQPDNKRENMDDFKNDRARRGGSWLDDPVSARAAFRSWESPVLRVDFGPIIEDFFGFSRPGPLGGDPVHFGGFRLVRASAAG